MERQPTLKQLEKLAKATHTPFGYLFLPEPPEERLPIPDFRTVTDAARRRPSPDLLDTLYTMRRRQEWLRETVVEHGMKSLAFVGSARLSDEPEAVGREMRRTLGLDGGWAAQVRTWQEAVGELRRAIERLGVMAVINGVVGNNTHRPLHVEEFRGFALADPYAPLVFVNGADAKSAQMFTLAHELAHIWLGTEGLSGFESLMPGGSDVEDWCNAAAAELLVPAVELRARWASVRREANRFDTVARAFKVSPIVAARRALDLRLVDRSQPSSSSTRASRVASAARAGHPPAATSTTTRTRASVSSLRPMCSGQPWRDESGSRRPTTSPGSVEEHSSDTPSGWE